METQTDKKRMYWLDEEVKTMLALVKEKNILREVDGKTKRNNMVYKSISEDLRLKKIYKSSDQIKTKLRFVKTAYFNVKRNNTKSGAGRKTCPYLEELDELYGTRPVASAVGVDTSEDDQNEDMMFPDVEYLYPTFEVDAESENDSFTFTNDDSSVSKPRQHQTPKKISLPQALVKMTDDFKEGFDKLTEQNEMFLREQRDMDAEFMRNMQQLMADDREATERFLGRLINKK